MVFVWIMLAFKQIEESSYYALSDFVDLVA